MRERYVNILAALRERYVSVLAALRGRFEGATWALGRRYVSASIAERERARRCLSAIAEIQSIADYKYSIILPFQTKCLMINKYYNK